MSARLSRRAGLTAVAAFLAVFAVPCLFFKPADWEKVYVAAADRLRAGDHVYDGRTGFVYPPFAALVAVPAAALSLPAARVLWWVANAVAGAVAFVGAWRLAGGPLTDPRTWPRSELIAFWLGVAAAVTFVSDAMTNRQIDLVLAALIIGGCRAVAAGRTVGGGGLIGLAAAIKCTPLLFAVYFAWTGRWRAAVAVVFIAVGANLLPDALYSPVDGRVRLVQWADRYLAGVSNPEVDPGVWSSGIQYNHSLGGVTNRLFTADLASANGDRFPVLRADRLGPEVLKGGVLAVGLVLLGLAAAVARGRRSAGNRAFAAEVGMVLTLMLLLSPMSSKPHFSTLLVPAWLVARAGMNGSATLLVIAMIAAGCGVMASKDLVGGRAYDALLWYGAIPLGTGALFAGCWLMRRQAVLDSAAELPVVVFPERQVELHRARAA